MIIKKNKLILLLIIISFFIVGCSTTNKEVNKSKEVKSIDDISVKAGYLECSREGTTSSGEPFFNYRIKYKNDEILELNSVEGITTDDSQLLDEYEAAYKEINKNYKNLDYYESTVVRNDSSVARNTTINYEKIDIQELLEIEGEEDNIIVDGKASLAVWLDFAGKFGTTCQEA